MCGFFIDEEEEADRINKRVSSKDQRGNGHQRNRRSFVISWRRRRKPVERPLTFHGHQGATIHLFRTTEAVRALRSITVTSVEQCLIDSHFVFMASPKSQARWEAVERGVAPDAVHLGRCDPGRRVAVLPLTLQTVFINGSSCVLLRVLQRCTGASRCGFELISKSRAH